MFISNDSDLESPYVELQAYIIPVTQLYHVGEAPRRIIFKAILWILSSDIQNVAGPLQVCAGQVGGCEAAIHAMRLIFNEHDVQAALLILLTDWLLFTISKSSIHTSPVF